MMDLHQGKRLLWYAFILSFGLMSISSAADINAELLTTIEDTMDAKVNPCENFYRYACGHWKPVDQQADTMGNLDFSYINLFRQILEDGMKSTKVGAKEVFGKLQKFYGSCKQQGFKTSNECEEENGGEECRRQKDEEPFLNRYLEIVKPTEHDDWPVDDQPWHPKEKWNIWNTLGRLARFGFNRLFFEFSFRQMNDGSYNVLLQKHEIQNREFNYITIGYSKNDSDSITNYMYELWDLDDEHEESLSEQWTLVELQKELEHFDFVAYLSAVLGTSDFGKVTITVNDVQYFRRMLKYVHATSQDILIKVTRNAFKYYLSTLAPWNLRCDEMLRRLLPLAVDYVYEQEVYSHIRPQTDAVIVKVFKSLQEKFVEQLEKNVYELSSEEVEVLKQKMLTMKLKIGDLPQDLDDQIFAEYYSSWEVVDGDLHRNILNFLKFQHLEISKIRNLEKFTPITKAYVDGSVSPFYNDDNIIFMPFAYIRFPIVHSEFHELFQYAELGNTLGQAMMYAFGPDGLKNGITSSVSVSDKPKFSDAVKCVAKKARNLESRVADYDGFRLSYETFFQQSVVPQFYGPTQLTNKQLFFIKYAQLFCGVSSSFGISSEIPYRRVNDNVANNADFNEIFSCPSKTVKRCNLWWKM